MDDIERRYVGIWVTNAGSGFVRPFPHSISFRATMIIFFESNDCRWLFQHQASNFRLFYMTRSSIFFFHTISANLVYKIFVEVISYIDIQLIRHKSAKIDPKMVSVTIWSSNRLELGFGTISSPIRQNHVNNVAVFEWDQMVELNPSTRQKLIYYLIVYIATVKIWNLLWILIVGISAKMWLCKENLRAKQVWENSMQAQWNVECAKWSYEFSYEFFY